MAVMKIARATRSGRAWQEWTEEDKELGRKELTNVTADLIGL
jgi:hypothetical protein